MTSGVYKRSEKHLQFMRTVNIGRRHTKETKMKLSMLMKGKNKGPLSSDWVGDKVGYMGMHNWLRNTYGYPKKCALCNRKGKKNNNRWNIDYAKRKDVPYKRDVNNFIGLCRSCHVKYDDCYYK